MTRSDECLVKPYTTGFSSMSLSLGSFVSPDCISVGMSWAWNREDGADEQWLNGLDDHRTSMT
jgi:hypothetical protein